MSQTRITIVLEEGKFTGASIEDGALRGLSDKEVAKTLKALNVLALIELDAIKAQLSAYTAKVGATAREITDVIKNDNISPEDVAATIAGIISGATKTYREKQRETLIAESYRIAAEIESLAE